MKRFLIPVCLVALCAPVGASDVVPAQPVASPATERAKKRAGIVDELRSPAIETHVQTWVARALTGSLADALVTVQALQVARGPFAVDGLVRLTRHRSRQVRDAAWRAIAAIASRRDELADLASREILNLSTPEDCEGLARAIGRVGDARHLNVLFEVATRENELKRKAAFSALRSICGVRLPDQLSHWMSWWRLRKRRGDVDLRAALEALETNRTKSVSLQSRIIQRDAWFDIPLVRETLRSWLRIHNPRLRALGAKLAAQLRLGDLIKELESLGTFANQADERQAAADALKALDVPPTAWRKRYAAKPEEDS